MSEDLFEVRPGGEGVVTLTIATDEVRHLGPDWVDGFTAALESIGADDSVRVLVLQGSERHFSAGASLEALSRGGRGDAVTKYAERAVRAVLDLPVPVLAAAAGHAIGGGLVLAAWCDGIALADESLYAANFAALGFTPGMGATLVIPELFGPSLGRELLYSGRSLTGREIRRACCPLSHAIHPRVEVVDRTLTLAREMAEVPRGTLILLKRELAGRRREPLTRVLEAERKAHGMLFADPRLVETIRSRYPVAPGDGGSDS